MRLPISIDDIKNKADFIKEVNDSRRLKQARELAGENARSELIEKVYSALPEYIPEGVSLSRNIERAKDMSPAQFIEKVKSGGEWDYKRRVGYSLYEDFGNANYAMTARGIGFPDWFSKMGAGLYQIQTGTSPLTSKDEFGKSTLKSKINAIIKNTIEPGSADDEKDQRVIKKAFDALDQIENGRIDSVPDSHVRANEAKSDTFDGHIDTSRPPN